MIEYGPLLRRALAGENLTQDEAATFVGEIMDGNYTSSQAAGLLVALAAKGESVDEIVGAARAMRARSLHVDHGLPMVVDVVGTGGDHANTFNISTMAALVVASTGIPVAKHGNRAASSACGSADVLEAAGLPIEIDPVAAAAMLRECSFTFMFAPRYHPAMRNAAAVRRELGVRTIFNLLGPLTNPANATHLVVGVPRPELVERIGEALRMLGAQRGAVVHGLSGIDEVVGDAPTLVYLFDERGASLRRVEPSDFGIEAAADAGRRLRRSIPASLYRNSLRCARPGRGRRGVERRSRLLCDRRRRGARPGLRTRANVIGRRRCVADFRARTGIRQTWLIAGSSFAAARARATSSSRSKPAPMHLA